jgi:cephalosporin hydroxylase
MFHRAVSRVMPLILRIDTEAGTVELDRGGAVTVVPFSDPRAFELVSEAWLRVGWDGKYVYRFSWLGRPIIQLPEDIVRLQEAVFTIRPDVIVETGIAHGGCLMLFASVCEALGHGNVVGVDVDVRPHNRTAIEEHPLSPRITIVDGSSIDEHVVDRVRELVQGAKSVFVLLDSNHSKKHVLAELRLYAPLVSVGSYIVVADGIMAQLAGAPRTSRNWVWDNPTTAVDEFLASDDRFALEAPMQPFDESSLTYDPTYLPRGWLRRVR